MSRKNEDGVYVIADNFEVNRYDFEGIAEEIKANIDRVVEKARAKGMVGEGRFGFSVCRTYYDDYELNFAYEFERVETEKEKTAREKSEAKRKEEAAKKRKATAEKKKLKADAEYAEFLRLKEKFGEMK
jgi:hypothetical protein